MSGCWNLGIKLVDLWGVDLLDFRAYHYLSKEATKFKQNLGHVRCK